MGLNPFLEPVFKQPDDIKKLNRMIDGDVECYNPGTS